MIPNRRPFYVLISIAFFLLAMHFLPETVSPTLRDRFDLDAEANIPSWFSTILLFAVSMSAFCIYKSIPATQPSRNFWLVFSLVYGGLSLDEAARLHEIIDPALKWIYLYAPLGFAFFAYCVRHFAQTPAPSSRNWILGGLLVYAAGGLGGEGVSYFLRPLPYVLQQSEFVFEEGLEMVGAILVLMGCRTELHRRSGLETTRMKP